MTGRTLVLSGTTEARSLCEALVAANHDVTASLAGVTSRPAAYACPVRNGGFGGADGLARWLQDNQISRLIDATHPHAAQMPRNAHDACRTVGIPCLHLKRPPWPIRSNHISAQSLRNAATLVPRGARVFLATGAVSSHEFHNRPDVRFVLRSIEPPRLKFPNDNATCLIARPPFAREQEEHMFREHGITHLVVKNSGGEAGKAKLDAADALGITTIMVERSPLPSGATVVQTVQEALAWLETHHPTHRR